MKPRPQIGEVLAWNDLFHPPRLLDGEITTIYYIGGEPDQIVVNPIGTHDTRLYTVENYETAKGRESV